MSCYLFSWKDSSPHKEAAVTTVTLLVRCHLWVYKCLPPQLMKSWLNYCSPSLEHVAFFLGTILKANTGSFEEAALFSMSLNDVSKLLMREKKCKSL